MDAVLEIAKEDTRGLRIRDRLEGCFAEDFIQRVNIRWSCPVGMLQLRKLLAAVSFGEKIVEPFSVAALFMNARIVFVDVEGMSCSHELNGWLNDLEEKGKSLVLLGGEFGMINMVDWTILINDLGIIEHEMPSGSID